MRLHDAVEGIQVGLYDRVTATASQIPCTSIDEIAMLHRMWDRVGYVNLNVGDRAAQVEAAMLPKFHA